jgi:hypothetical protein
LIIKIFVINTVLISLFSGPGIFNCPVFGAEQIKGPLSNFFIGPDSQPYKGNILIVYSTGGPARDVKWLRELCLESVSLIKDKVFKDKIKIIKDTDFDPAFFGKFRIQIIGPFEHNIVLKKYYSDLPFAISELALTAEIEANTDLRTEAKTDLRTDLKTESDKGLKMGMQKNKNKNKIISLTGDDLGLITIWPQPHQSRGYTLINTAGSYSALKKTFDGCGLYTDYVIHNSKTVESCRKESFLVMGNYDKTGLKWQINPDEIYYPHDAEAFFQKHQKEAEIQNMKFSPAPYRNILLKTGRAIKGKVFRGEKRKAIVKINQNEKEKFLEIDLEDIQSIDECINFHTMFHDSDKRSQMIYSEWALLDDNSIIATDVTDKPNYSGKTYEFLNIVILDQLESAQDIFGNEIKFREIKKTHNKYVYKLKLNYPVKRGEKIFLRLKSTIKDCITQNNGLYTLKCDYIYSILGRPFKIYFNIPDNIEIVSVYPKAKTVTLPGGRALIFSGLMPLGEIYSVKLEYRHKK